jgi:hypothetical protein
VGNNVYRLETPAPFQRGYYLASRGPPCIDHDGVDLRSQVSKDRLKITDGRINEKNF